VRKPYYLKKRGDYWYYKLPEDTAYHSCKMLNNNQNVTSRSIAEKLVVELIGLKPFLDKYNLSMRDYHDLAKRLIKKHFEDIAGDLTLREYAKDFFVWDRCQWIRSLHQRDLSFSRPVAKQRRSHLERYIFPVFGDLRLREIQKHEIDQWLMDLPLANQTKNHIRYTFKIVLSEAMDNGLIERNPIDSIRAFKNKHEKREILLPADIDKLFPHEQEKLIAIWGSLSWASMFFLLLTTGMRVGEVRALRWKDVEWESGAVIIRRAAKEDGPIGLPKNTESRAAFIPARTDRMLRLLLDLTPCPLSEDLVFFGPDATTPLSRRGVWSHFKKGVSAAGITKNIVVHSLRHTYNTMMKNVVPLDMLQLQIGHKSDRMSEHYDKSTEMEKLLKFIPERQKIDSLWS